MRRDGDLKGLTTRQLIQSIYAQQTHLPTCKKHHRRLFELDMHIAYKRDSVDLTADLTFEYVHAVGLHGKEF